MQTVNFNCPHCGNLMAVGTNLLGRNVRCPHCKQVVRAPAAPGEAPAVQGPAVTQMPAFNIPGQTAEHHESIFGERHDEDLFGSEPLKPKLPPVAPPPSPLAETAYAPPAPAPQYSETQTYVAPMPPEPAYTPPADSEPAPPDQDRAEPGPRRVYRPATARTESPGTPAFAWILLAYSAVVTVVAGIFAYQYFASGSGGEHPFKAIPDFYGKYEKATGAENRKQLSYQGMPDPKMDVPADLRVKLGDELTVGDIQVKPTQVFQQTMEVTRKNATRDDVTSLAGAGLVLGLHVKNVSTDTTFHPDDPAFNRAFDKDQPPPYTALQIGRDFFYGPFAWPLDAEIKDVYMTGFQNPEEPLGPGQERDIWIPVAPKGMRNAAVSDVITAKDRVQGDAPMLWRVQLRRGLVKAKTDDGKDVDVSATTVIGVVFTPSQVKNR